MKQTWLVALLALVALPAQATQTDAERVTMLRAQQQRLVQIAERLTTAAAPWCEGQRTLGWSLADLGSFPKAVRQQVRNEWGLPSVGSLFVAAVAPGSVAARAGIAPGMAIMAINGATPMRYNGDSPSTHALASNQRLVTSALTEGTGMVTVEVMGADQQRRTVQLTGRPACGSVFQVVVDDVEQAYADGKQVYVTMGMVRYAQTDDELASVVAHELAHNMLQHIDRQDVRGIPANYTRHLTINARQLRGMEEESDRLSVWLLAAAGFAPDAPVAFWQRFGPDHDSAHPYGRLHDPWELRVASLRDEVVTMRAARLRQRNARPPLIDAARAELAGARAAAAAANHAADRPVEAPPAQP